LLHHEDCDQFIAEIVLRTVSFLKLNDDDDEVVKTEISPHLLVSTVRMSLFLYTLSVLPLALEAVTFPLSASDVKLGNFQFRSDLSGCIRRG